ncbi:1-aminocyclopropane-1-carboxylate deaminase [Streptomyces albipurpureus]|uniref:1-aminocyclopropane-1-carboxylate deaminase n=1 Tax=Streptomyces albipurpureus TaxID=2897419 RepID=A0ABT0ULM7_9ACTN|nr:1-aminocyclopropane-1-carboxylate deaminase [Streptomyces sp. CWNU-1]MCM2388166.1 1-aminocyclopropane-1-carboxylate deaminase [Streptomyces sp. CWNU-1]
MYLDRFPRYPLTFGPTPLEPLPRLSADLGGKVEIWAKRDDCNSGLAFGGNKTRKLEYLVPDAIAQDCDTLVSIGGIQSNHTRQVAAVAAKIGMKCRLVQGSWVDWKDVTYDRVGNVLLSRVLGAQLDFSEEEFSIGVKESWEKALEQVRSEGGKPYPIPIGASDHPLGGLGYARFADELRQQESDLGFTFDFIVVCSASGSTQAGMVVGLAREGRSQSVIGIDVTASPVETRNQIRRIAENTAELLGVRHTITDADIVLDTRYAFPGYGVPSTETVNAIRRCARLEGMMTDPVYEGKSMQGMIDMVERGEFPSGSRVLYVHLGGVPALSAYSYPFLSG